MVLHQLQWMKICCIHTTFHIAQLYFISIFFYLKQQMNASSATSNFVRISLLLLLFTIYTVVLSITPPTFIKDFKASVQSDVVVAQGDVKSIGGGGACCAAGTPGCQLQGIFSLDKVEEQGTKERSRDPDKIFDLSA